MLTLDKNTKHKLLVVTNPNCAVCREMNKSGKCDELPLTKKILLAPFGPSDELSLQVIFKAKNPMEAYKKLLKGEPLSDNEIDWTKDITAEWKENIELFDSITKKYEVKGTPTFFILDENDTIIDQIKLEMEPADVLMFNIRNFL